MAAGKDWHRRLPAVLHLARVVSAAKDAGGYEIQMVPGHQVAAMAGRVARIARMHKAVPVTGLAKMGAGEGALWGASLALPVLGASRVGRKGLNWAGRQIDRAAEATGLAAPRRRRRMPGVAKAAPATARDWLDDDLRKVFPLAAAANIASMVIPAVASSSWGKRAIGWGTRKLLGFGASRTARAAAGGVASRGVRMATAAGPTLSGKAGVGIRSGRSAGAKLLRNPGRAILGTNRHLYNNRGSYLLAGGTALGGYEADQNWREASPKRRMMGDV